MKNVVILGSARSGTSMLAEVFHRSGAFLGPDLLPPTPGNPHGYFESRVIEDLNEDLLAPVAPRRWSGRGARVIQRWQRHIPDRSRRWLLALPLNRRPQSNAGERERMRALVRETPWCFKDPRFSYTLPAWRDVLGDAVRICLFRAPQASIRSMEREWREGGHDQAVSMTSQRFARVWEQSYRHALAQAEVESDYAPWLFIERDSLFAAGGQTKVEEAVGAPLDWSQVDPRLSRSPSAAESAVSPRVDALFARLQAKAK